MQCACAILSSVACPALQYFSTLFHKRHKFRKKSYLKLVFRVSLHSLSQTFFILKKLNDIWWKIDIGLLVKCPLFLSDFNVNTIFSKFFWKILKYQISGKSVQSVPSRSMRAEGRAGSTNLIVVLAILRERPQKEKTHTDRCGSTWG